jgi:hypothetical protein
MISSIGFFLMIAFTLSGISYAKTTMKEIEVDSGEQAKKIITNRIRYLNLLFEQSRDPYYGKLKWSPECLASNKVGKLEESEGSLFFRSQLYLDDKGREGVCKGALSEVIMSYCKNEKVVRETKTQLDLKAKKTVKDLCK